MALSGVHGEWLRGIGGRFADVADEIERYQGEIARLRAELSTVRNGADEAHREIIRFRAELAEIKASHECLITLANDRLAGERYSKQEIARLREALEDIADEYNHARWWRTSDALRQVARAALAPRLR